MLRVNRRGLPASTRKVCEMVAEKTDTCTIAVSRGKDSIACWLIIREYFKHVIPYYTVNIPTNPLPRHEQEYLDYCEKQFETKIHLYVNGFVGVCIDWYLYQPWQDWDKIEDLNIDEITEKKYFDYIKSLREITGCSKNSWGCSGIKGCDNGLMRRMFTKRGIGIREEDHTFYPVYDWTHNEVFEFLAAHETKLPSDYMCHNKTIMGVPTAPQLEWLRDNMPDDYAKVLQTYPMIEVQIARNEFRRMRRS